MKKRITVIFMAVILLLAFSACGEAEESKNQMFGEIPDEYKAGDIPVDFEVELLDGETVRLSDFKGKVVLLNFWFITCRPCVAELPAFEMLQEEFADDLVVLAVNSRDRRAEVEEFIREKGYTFDVGVDRNGIIEYPLRLAPYTLIIDREGVISSVRMGAYEDDAQPMYEEYKPEIEMLV